MSAASRFALFLSLLVALLVATAGSASAQAGETNPSGGTSLRPYAEEGGVPAGAGTIRLRSELNLRGWVASALSQRFVRGAARPSPSATGAAITRRQVRGR